MKILHVFDSLKFVRAMFVALFAAFFFGCFSNFASADTVKNLFNKDTYSTASGYYINNGKVASAPSNKTVVIDVKPNTTYSYWHTAGTGGGRSFATNGIVEIGDDASWLNNQLTIARNEMQTITIPSNMNKLYICVGRSGNQSSFEEQFADFMLVEGIPDSTDYVPFVPEQIKIATTKYNEAAFAPVEKGQEAIAIFTDTSEEKVLASPGRVGTRLLITGRTNEDAEEKAYSLAASAVQELERAGCGMIRIGVGEIVDCPENILHSFRTARHIRHLLVERKEESALILGVREMGDVTNDMPAVINEAKVFMSQNFQNPNLMLQDAAAAVNMSKSRFSAVFSQYTGKTFTEYLLYLRLGKAKELLRTTGEKSSAIAYEAGYNDAHYFSYIFKKNTGMTPSEYRARYHNQPE